MPRVADAIERKLNQAFAPTRLTVVDESYRHAGHAGARPEGETHFRIEVVSAAFAGHGRVARQRLVYGALVDELRTDIHALQFAALLTPDEDAAR